MSELTDRWISNVGRSVITHGYCYCNINHWRDEFNKKDLTPQMVARMVELMVFEPKLELEAVDFDEKTGRFIIRGKVVKFETSLRNT